MKKISVLICLGFFLYQCNSEAERFILSEAFSESVSTTAATSPCESDDCLNVNESLPDATDTLPVTEATDADATDVEVNEVNVADVLEVDETADSSDIDADSDVEDETTADVIPPEINAWSMDEIRDRLHPTNTAESDDTESEVDTDGDGVLDEDDNCIDASNVNQANQNEDFDDVGDVCDYINDTDEDGLADAIDVQITKFNVWYTVDPEIDLDAAGFVHTVTLTFVAGRRTSGKNTKVNLDRGSTLGLGILVKGVVNYSLSAAKIVSCEVDDGDKVGICIVSETVERTIPQDNVKIDIPQHKVKNEVITPTVSVDQMIESANRR